MQVSKTQTIRLANAMGMDIDNAQDQIGILDALTSVSNPYSFTQWIKDNRETISYSNRRDKLTILHKKYKDTIDNIPTGLLQRFSKEVATKFKNAIQVLRDNEEHLTDNLRKLNSGGVQYFTKKEIELLDATGCLNRLISLHELGTLNEALYSASVKKTLISMQPTLTDNQKKVKQLLHGAVR